MQTHEAKDSQGPGAKDKPQVGILKALPDFSHFAALTEISPLPECLPAISAPANTGCAKMPCVQPMVDALPTIIYKPRMICAFTNLIMTADSRGFAVGPEGMRVR